MQKDPAQFPCQQGGAFRLLHPTELVFNKNVPCSFQTYEIKKTGHLQVQFKFCKAVMSEDRNELEEKTLYSSLLVKSSCVISLPSTGAGSAGAAQPLKGEQLLLAGSALPE